MAWPAVLAAGIAATGQTVATVGNAVAGAKGRIAQKQADLQNKLNEDQARRNHAYNEDAANKADTRTRRLWDDLYGPQALVNQYNEANLNPALMYGMGGGQGQTSSGAQGGGASGPSAGSAPNLAALEQAGTAKGALALSAARTIAEINLMKSQAGNLDKDSELKETEKGVNEATVSNLNTNVEKAKEEIKYIVESTENKRVERDNLELQGEWQRILNKQQPEKFQAEMKNLGEHTAWVIKQAEGQEIENQNKEAYVKAQINQFNANATKALAEAAYAEVETKMTEEQIKLIDDWIRLAWKQEGLVWYRNAEEGSEEYDLQLKDIEARIKREIGWTRWSKWTDTAGGIGIAIGGIMGGAGSFIKNVITPKRQQQQWEKRPKTGF